MDQADGGVSLRIERVGHDAVVWAAGELDLASAPALADCLASLNGGTVTLDMSGVTFVDSSALHVLAQADQARRGNGTSFVLRGVQPGQRTVLEITGLDEVLTIVDG